MVIAAQFVERAVANGQLDPKGALAGVGKPVAEFAGERTPAVPIRRSVHRDSVVCLDCGWRGKMLRRHLATGDGLTVEQCRARWKLTREHEMTAPVYSERRSGLATTQDLIWRNRDEALLTWSGGNANHVTGLC